MNNINKIKKISLNISNDQYNQLSECAAETDRSISGMIRQTIDLYLNQYNQWKQNQEKN